MLSAKKRSRTLLRQKLYDGWFVRFSGRLPYDWTAPTILKNDHDQLRQLPRFAYIEEVGRELDGLWLRIIDEGKRTGQVRSDVDSSVLYRFIRNSISSWHQPSSKLSLAELAELYNVLIFEGIAGPL